MPNRSKLYLNATILCISVLINGCGGFYSTISRLELVRLGPKLENGSVVAEVAVLLNNSRPPPGPLNFTLAGDSCLTVDNAGVISVVGICSPKSNGSSQLVRRFEVRASLPHLPLSVTVPVTLAFRNSTCDPSPEMCFAGRMSFRVHQDARGVTHEVPLGRIGQRGSGCKLKPEYTLDPGEVVGKLHGDVLWVRTSVLEDDTNVTVRCSVGGVSFNRTFAVAVLPRTPWEISSSDAIRLIGSTAVEKGDSFIVSWGFFKEGSRADLVQTSKTSLYTLRMDKELISSYIANKTLFIISLEWSLCCPNISLPIAVEANLEVSEPGFHKEEVRLRSVLQMSDFCTSLPKLTYPSRIELSPGLSSLARLAYPNRTRDFATTLSNVSFHSVLPPDLTSPFGVTTKAGIIYLDEGRVMQYHYLNFTGVLIEWRLNQSLLQVSWVPAVWNQSTPKSNTCESMAFIPGHDHSSDFLCSLLESKKECQSTCGLGASASKGGFCSWITPSKFQKPSNSSKKSFKISYTTCSTDKTFCPDGLCDPLEQLGELRNVQICPQDCTAVSVLFGNLDGSDNRGINQLSKGLCTCDQLGACHCSRATSLPPQPKDRMGKVSSRQELQKDGRVNAPIISTVTSVIDTFPVYRPIEIPNSGLKATCDGSCLVVLLTVGTGVTLTLVLMSAYICKKSRSSCGNQHKSEMNYNSTYGTEALILSDMTMIEAHHQIEIDESWEIPRCCLTVEECLGEGEFGRVLRGTALDLKNYPGYTTVAVKTLKDNAGSAELSDLLSEYQLLKKVDHKNVIKLLGACIAPGGPIYIIIEYCALGSLRAYLRMHRNLKTNADMGARIPENASMITPKDVLSFAYQISKGMAYLADIKFVHRDLAARNVLIAEGKICKISDFGLTRDVYEDDTYLKQSRGRVPVKWMAIESLADHIYTTQSDVWSFGIVLWELVTLGASPYPGVTIQNLYHLLKNGYRMQKPLNCTTELYEVMRECWCERPDDRPTFLNLVEKFGHMLERGLDYVNFSIQMISNPSYFNPCDLHDDDKTEMNITFKMELRALQENNNRYENYSVGPDTSYDTPRPTVSEQVLTNLITSEHDHPLAQRT